MKKRTPIFGIACLLAMTTALLAGCGCSDSTATPDEAVDTSIQTVTEIVTDEQGNTYIEEATKVVDLKTDKKSDDESEKTKSNDKKDSSSNKAENSSSDKTNNNSNNNSSSSKNSSSSSNKNTSSNKNNSSSSDKNTSTNNNSNSTSKNEEPKHTHSWVSLTRQIKVVDQEAYTYEEPVYEMQGRTFCNVCGADITENRREHSKNHALNNEGGGYHDEWVKIQVGTKTVEVPEKSHYETEVIGRKCNSCGENEYY